MSVSDSVPSYPLHAILGVVAAALLGGALLFANVGSTTSFTASDGSVGSVTCASVWTHWFNPGTVTNVSDPITLTASANGTDDPTDSAYQAANNACSGYISGHQGVVWVLLIGGVIAAASAVVQKRRTRLGTNHLYPAN
jgi:hypothetical protein